MRLVARLFFCCALTAQADCLFWETIRGEPSAFDPGGNIDGTPGGSGTPGVSGTPGPSAMPASCANDVRDGDETGTDCGGSCTKCDTGQTCGAATDCVSGFCSSAKTCVTACFNEQRDGDETDTDCGGSCAANCAEGKACLVNADCVKGGCVPATLTCGCATASPTPTSPVIFFTDITSGPTTGGEGDLGVFISIYGERFGTSVGSVTIGGVPVAKINDWNTVTNLARGLERIVVQPGASVPGGRVVVTSLAGKSSNAAVFTKRAGNIYFLGGAPGGGTLGSSSNPFQTIAEAFTGISSGDTLYVKSFDRNLVNNRYFTPPETKSGTPSAPTAVIGYYNVRPALGGMTTLTMCNNTYGIETTAGLHDFVIANVATANVCTGFVAQTSGGLRLVGLFLDAYSEGLFGDRTIDGLTILGTTFKGSAGSSGRHPLTLGRDTGGVGFSTKNVEIGWSEFASVNYWAAITIGTSVDSSLTSGISIHDSLVEPGGVNTLHLMEFYVGGAGSLLNDVRFTNNVFRNNDGWAIDVDPVGLGAVVFEHNTFASNSANTLFNFNDPPTVAGTIALSFNILKTAVGADVGSNGAGTTEVPFTGGYNYWSLAAPPAFDAAHGHADTSLLVPFANAPSDLRLKDDTVWPVNAAQGSTVCYDYDGVARPQQSGSDVGAYERP